MINTIIIDDEIVRIKRKIEDLEYAVTTLKTNKHFHVGNVAKLELELYMIYNTLKEI